MAGRPAGSQNKDKPYREALRRAIARAEQAKSPHALDRIADKHLAEAASGDVAAINSLADRLDGKPAQESTLNVTHSVRELTDEQIATRIAELRGIGASDGDDKSPLDPSQLN
jgi:predicted RNA-binding Zn ribbon-like protein